MAFKYTCILLLVSLVFLMAQAKHVKKDKKGNTKQKDPQKYTTFYDRVKYKGEWKDCDDFNTIDSSGTGCNCPFVACTGSQQCTTLSGINCRFLHKNVDVNNMSREDCAYQVYTKRYDRVKYRGEWKDCDDFHTIDDSGNGCNCPFVACTGSQQCIGPMGFFCRFLHKNVDVNDMSREDCACKYLK